MSLSSSSALHLSQKLSQISHFPRYHLSFLLRLNPLKTPSLLLFPTLALNSTYSKQILGKTPRHLHFQFL